MSEALNLCSNSRHLRLEGLDWRSWRASESSVVKSYTEVGDIDDKTKIRIPAFQKVASMFPLFWDFGIEGWTLQRISNRQRTISKPFVLTMSMFESVVGGSEADIDLPMRLRPNRFNMQITEVLFAILQYCDAPTVATCLSVSHAFNDVGTSNLIWKPIISHKEDYFPSYVPRHTILALEQQVDLEMEDPEDCVYREAIRPLRQWHAEQESGREKLQIRREEKCLWLAMAIIFSILFPPIGVFLQWIFIYDQTSYGEEARDRDRNKLKDALNRIDGILWMIIAIALTLTGWIPGSIFALVTFGFWNLREKLGLTYLSPGLVLILFSIVWVCCTYCCCIPEWLCCYRLCKPLCNCWCENFCSDCGDCSDCCDNVCPCCSSSCYDDPCRAMNDVVCDCMLCQD